MSQHDYNISNATFPSVRSDINNALGAVATNNSGNSAPSTTYANQWWFDSDDNQLYIRNKDNDSFVKVFTVGATSDKIDSIADSISIADAGGVTITVADNSDNLTLTTTDADGSIGPNLRLYRNSASPADNDDLSTIDFEGRNDASQDVQYGMIRAILKDASDGTEDGLLEFHHMKNGSLAPSLQIGPDECVINESSNDYDFRVESNGNANMFHINGGSNIVGIGADPDLGVGLHIKSADTGASVSTNADELVIEGTRSGMTFLAANDNFSYINFGDDGASDRGTIRYGHSTDSFSIQTAATERVLIGTSEIAFNDASNDYDFRVESNGRSHALFVDAGNDKVGIGTSDPASYYYDQLTVTAGDEGGITIIDTSSGQSALAFADGTTGNEAYRGRVLYNHATDFIEMGAAGQTTLKIDGGTNRSFLNETADTKSDNGFTINQSTGDNPIFALKSSDVAHGITDVAETDTYAYFEKKGGAQGGLVIGGLVESGFIAGIELNSNVTQADNAETTGAEGAIQTQSLIKSGTGTTAMGADDNIFVCRNSTTQFIVKGDGELFSNQSATVGTFDEYEDAHLVRAYDLSHGKGVIDSSFDKFVKYNKDDLRKARLIGSDKEGNATPFVNITGMSRLHNGAIWQQYEKHQRLASAFYKLAEKTIGKEEADKLLTEEEIQLLN